MHMGKHVADIHVPPLHVLAEMDVVLSEVVEVAFQLQVLCLSILGVFDPLSGRAEPGVI